MLIGMARDKVKLFQYIGQLSFVVDELRLYLDTHPCDEEALCHFKKVSKERKEALEEYTECYGPIYSYQVDVDNYWSWINDPWPWEGVC